MEDNNNNDRSLTNTIKKEVNNQAEKIKKKALSEIIKKIAPFVAIFIICLLAIGLLMAVVFMIMNLFKGMLGFDSDASTTTEQEAQAIVSITDEGYKINDDYSTVILERLRELSTNVDIEKFGLYLDDEKLGDMLDKYIKAEIKTMYPQLGIGENDGAIIIKRRTSDNKLKTLNYKKYSEFEELISNNDKEALNYFSINPDDFTLRLAVGSITKYYIFNEEGRVVEDTAREEITIEEREPSDYQALVSKYATPVNYFVSMHMITGDAEFMNEIVEKVMNSDLKIILTIADNGTEEVEMYEYDGTITEKHWNYSVKLDDQGDPILDANGDEQYVYNSGEPGISVDITNINAKDYSDDVKDYYKKVTQNITGSLGVTYSNTWLLNTKVLWKFQAINKQDIQKDQKRQISPKSDTPVNSGSTPSSGTQRTGTITETANQWTQELSIKSIDLGEGYNIDFLLNLIKQYPKVEDNLKSASNFLFYLLESQENTQELSRVMRYVIMQLSMKSYGVNQLEFFDAGEFTDLDDPDAVDENGSEGALGHVELDGSFNVNGVCLSNPLPNFTYASTYSGHKGIDLHSTGRAGDPVYAAADGTVITAEYHSSWGNYVKIDHGNGIYTLYAHAQSLCVSVGQKVTRGQLIMYEGSTGNSTGPHVHFEIWVNGSRNQSQSLTCQMFGINPE